MSVLQEYRMFRQELKIAAQEGHLKRVKNLFAGGLFGIDDYTYQVLTLAAQPNHLRIIRFLVKKLFTFEARG